MSLSSIRWVCATVIGSSAQICSSRSPPLYRSSSRSISGKAGQVGETGRPVGRQSDLVEQGGPESDGHAHPRRGGREFGGGVSQRGSAGGDAVNVVGQDLQHLDQPSRVDAVAQVERAERGERLRGRGDAGLVLAVERYRR